MITNLRPYTATRDSGVPWIGAVPKHWQIRRLGSLLQERGETNSDGREERVLSVLRGRGVIPYAEKGNVGNKQSEDITRYKIVRPNDIVVNSMNVIIGSVGLSRYSGCLSPVYYVLTRRSVHDNPRYLDSLFQVTPFQKSLVRIGNGILAHRMRIPMELLKCENFPYPPHDEQTAIVRFLGHIDQKIQRLIRAKRKLLTLLQQQRESVIHRAVTRGLAPDMRLKPSGIEWLGDVPEHWTIERLHRSVQGCFNGIWGNDPNGHDDLICVRVADFDRVRRRVRLSKPTVRAIIPAERNHRLLKNGDLMLEKSGGGDSQPVGVVILYDHNTEAVSSNFIARMQVARQYDSNFLVYLHSHLYAIRLNVRSIKQTTGIQNLDSSSYLRELVAFPPLTEQVAIASFLDRANSDIDKAMEFARQEISLLAEYRTRLIADVVTGKLDVRETVVYTQESFDESGSTIAGDVRVHVTEDESADVLETET